MGGWMVIDGHSNNQLIWATIDHLSSDLILSGIVCNLQLMVFSQATFSETAYVKHKDCYFPNCQPGWYTTPVLAARLPLTLTPLYG